MAYSPPKLNLLLSFDSGGADVSFGASRIEVGFIASSVMYNAVHGETRGIEEADLPMTLRVPSAAVSPMLPRWSIQLSSCQTASLSQKR